MDLLEREAAAGELDAALTQVRRSRQGRIALLHGEAGIGKTAFATDFTRRHHPPHPVLWGGCDSLFTPRPLGPLYDMALAGLPDVRARLERAAGWFDVATALLEALQRAPQAPIVVFEDIHWADEATLDLLKTIGRRMAQTPALLILTYRDEIDRRHPLRSLLGDLPPRHSLHLPLQPLSEDAVAALAHRAHRPAAGLHAVTGGNPFFVTELLRAGGDSAPPTVSDAVLARAAPLPPAARELLELASIVPGAVELWLLEQAAPAPTASGLDDCIQGGFLTPSADTAVAFRHELARQAIEAALPPGRRQRLHRAILQALLEAPAGAMALARLVHHAAGAGDAARVAEFAPRLAQQAGLHGAHREAAGAYRLALEHAAHLPAPEHARLLDALAFENYLTGRILEAIQQRLQAAELWRQTGHIDRLGDDLRALSRLYWFAGDKRSADDYAGQAIHVLETLQVDRSAGEAPPGGKELALAYSNRSQLAMLAEDTPAAIDWGQKALALAEAYHDVEITVHALTNLGTARMNAWDEAGRAQLERALELARRHDLHDDIARAYANLTSLSVQRREYAAAQPYLQAGLDYTRERDMDSYSIYLRGWQARWLFEQGRWDEALAEAQSVVQDSPGAAVIGLPGITCLGFIYARRGDPQATHWLDQARDLAMPTSEFQRIGPVAAARAEAAWWRGDPAGVLPEAAPLFAARGPLGDAYPLGALAYWVQQAGGQPPADLPLPAAYRSMLAGDWRAAAQAWERLGCPFEQALALSAGGLPARQSALAIFERLGADPAARRLRAELAGGGVRLPRGPRPSTRRNPFGLTARQMDVLAALDQGLSNAEIAAQLSISGKTVEHHITAILTKLGAASRLEAVALARREKLL